MSENWVRCVRCHEVFDAADEVCPKCGHVYEPPVAKPLPAEGLYTERYAGTEFVPQPEPQSSVMLPPRRSPLPYLVGGGILLVTGFVFSIAAGVWGSSPGPVQAPIVVVGTSRPTTPPAPLPSSLAATLEQLNGRTLTAGLAVQSRADVDVRVTGKAQSITASFTGSISGSNQAGLITQSHGTTNGNFCLYNGRTFARANAGVPWSATGSLPSFLVIAPLFGLTEDRMLQVVGVETRDGQTVTHFRTTAWWKPDVNRMAMIDTSTLGIRPDTFALDLWTAADGSPVAAQFSATNSAVDGTKLIDIETTYTFSDVGTTPPIPDPLATPAPSTSPRASHS